MELRAKYEGDDLVKLAIADLKAKGFEATGSRFEPVHIDGQLCFELWLTITPSASEPVVPSSPAPNPTKGKGRNNPEAKAKFKATWAKKRAAREALQEQVAKEKEQAVIEQAEKVVEEAVAATVAPFR